MSSERACGWVGRWDGVLWEFRFLKKKTHAFHESLIQTVPNSRAKGGRKKKIRVAHQVSFLIFEVSC